MFNRIPARKRKRAFKKFILRSIFFLGFIGLLGAAGFYLFFVKSEKSLYISPISTMNFSADSQNDDLASFKNELKQNNISFESVTASRSSYVVQLKNGGTVVFSLEKSIFSQISSLQFILSRLTMEGITFKGLDLRFDKPIITK